MGVDTFYMAPPSGNLEEDPFRKVSSFRVHKKCQRSLSTFTCVTHSVLTKRNDMVDPKVPTTVKNPSK